MLSFLKKLLTPAQAPKTHPFYSARLVIEAAHIVLYTHDDSCVERIAKQEVDRIMMYGYSRHGEYDRCWVDLKSDSAATVSVTSLAGGFDALESWMLGLPQFDLAAYQEYKNKDVDYKNIQLWVKKSPADYELVVQADDSNKSDISSLQQGIYLEHIQTLIEWGSYRDLGKHGFIQQSKVSYPNPAFSGRKYTISKPVIFAGLRLAELYTECDAYQQEPKLDLPVIRYISPIKLGFFNHEKSFLQVKQQLDRFLAQAGTNCSDSSEESLNFQWAVGKVTVNFYCFYRAEHSAFDNTAWLNIHYSPNLDGFYSNRYRLETQQEDGLVFHLLPFALDLDVNYRSVENAIYTPSCFSNNFDELHRAIVWHDRRQGIIGFGNAEFSRIFDADAVKGIYLAVQNFRGSEGRNSLEIESRQSTSSIGSVSDTGLFKNNIKQITVITGKSVNSYTYDEHY